MDKNQIINTNSNFNMLWYGDKTVKEYKNELINGLESVYKKYFNYDNIINKTDKLSFYIEAMLKVYLLNNKRNIKNYKDILDSKIWYNQTNMFSVYKTLERKDTSDYRLKNTIK